MYSLLIVEDEILVRHGLLNFIDWKALGISSVMDASDGAEAWEICCKKMPDILITDLNMPLISGMELIERIRQANSKTKIIILTCLEEFDLVREAITYGVSAYIPKLSMNNNEIEDVIKDVVRELESEEKDFKMEIIDEHAIGTLQDHFIKEIIYSGNENKDNIENKLHKLKLNINSNRVLVCRFKILHYDRFSEKFESGKEELVRFSMKNIIQEVLDAKSSGHVFHENDGHFIIVLNLPGSDLQIEEYLFKHTKEVFNQIIEIMDMYYNVKIAFGVSSVKNNLEHLHKLHFEATEAMNEYKIIEDNIEYYDFRKKWHDKRRASIERLKSPLPNAMNDSKIQDIYLKKLNEFIELNKYEDEVVKNFWRETTITILEELALSREAWNHLVNKIIEGIKQCEMISEIFNLISEVLQDALLFGEETNDSFPITIREALSYMKVHYSDNISLQQVSIYVGLSANYCSNLIKKETGLTFGEWLNNIRLAKVQQLLKDTSVKTYEIALKSGFSDESYMSRVFKKALGITPSEFRKRNKN